MGIDPQADDSAEQPHGLSSHNGHPAGTGEIGSVGHEEGEEKGGREQPWLERPVAMSESAAWLSPRCPSPPNLRSQWLMWPRGYRASAVSKRCCGIIVNAMPQLGWPRPKSHSSTRPRFRTSPPIPPNVFLDGSPRDECARTCARRLAECRNRWCSGIMVGGCRGLPMGTIPGAALSAGGIVKPTGDPG